MAIFNPAVSYFYNDNCLIRHKCVLLDIYLIYSYLKINLEYIDCSHGNVFDITQYYYYYFLRKIKVVQPPIVIVLCKSMSFGGRKI